MDPVSVLGDELPKGTKAKKYSLVVVIATFMLGVGGTAAFYERLIIAGKNATIERLEKRSPDADEKLIESLKADLKRFQDSYGERLAHEWEPLTETQINEWTAA